ncbi:FkbM family methyltransferase, partial [Flavobacteriaceae bacterium]|nr:FkbM family methyltransferase [Flavobacteriaceae bacterium]
SNFSQSNEEIILDEAFTGLKSGFYVDVGCHHPRRFSNTAMLYKKGWNGINIDASQKNLKLFNIFRKRDKNINALISEKPEKLKYYYFDDSALNGILSFSKVNSLKDLGYKVISEEYIVTQRLDDIITNLKLPNERIDLLDIDVEGYDFQVLKSIDLSLFNVRVILIETGDNENEIAKYLLKYNYSFYKKIDRNSFFLKDSI